MLDFRCKDKKTFRKKVFKNQQWCVKIHNKVFKIVEFAIFEHLFFAISSKNA